MRSSAALFGNPGGSSGTKDSNAAGSSGGNLIEFRAGKMLISNSADSKQQVIADKRPGVIYVHQPADGMTHFCWKERNATQPEDDLIVMPDDAIFIPIKKGKSNDRIYMLRFRANRKAFFWMQEPNEERDEERVTKLNDIINGIITVVNQGGSSGGASRRLGTSPVFGTSGSRLGGLDFQDILDSLPIGQLNHSDIVGLLSSLGADGGAGLSGSSAVAGNNKTSGVSSTTGTSSSASAAERVTAGRQAALSPSRQTTGPSAEGSAGVSTSSGVKFSRLDLQSIFSSMNLPAKSASDNKVSFPRSNQPILSDVLTVEKILPLIKDDASALKEIIPHLPEVKSSQEVSNSSQLTDTLVSPFFKSALRNFSLSLQAGELGDVVEQFKLGSQAKSAAMNGDLLGFCRSLEGQEEDQSEASNLMDSSNSAVGVSDTPLDKDVEEKNQPESMDKD